jgi:hypothetical protein
MAAILLDGRHFNKKKSALLSAYPKNYLIE